MIDQKKSAWFQVRYKGTLIRRETLIRDYTVYGGLIRKIIQIQVRQQTARTHLNSQLCQTCWIVLNFLLVHVVFRRYMYKGEKHLSSFKNNTGQTFYRVVSK